LRDIEWGKGLRKGCIGQEKKRGCAGGRKKHGNMCRRTVEDGGQREHGRRWWRRYWGREGREKGV